MTGLYYDNGWIICSVPDRVVRASNAWAKMYSFLCSLTMTTIAPLLLSQWPRASWQFLPIAPLEMVHAVEAGATAPFDLQEEVGSLAHDVILLTGCVTQ